MITDGFVLAILTGGAFYFLFIKLPKKVQKFLSERALLTDAVACLLTYMLFGGTLTALFASAWLSIFVSLLFLIGKSPGAMRGVKQLKSKIQEMKDAALSWMEEQFPEKDKEMENVR